VQMLFDKNVKSASVRVTRLGNFSPTFWVIVFFGQFFNSA
jgi:hypothetical protein